MWGSIEEIERQKRIRASVAAYAYEFEDYSIMTDGEFDALCLSINTEIRTGKRVLDLFFRTEFYPDSGVWIHDHPELEKVRLCYERHYKRDNKKNRKKARNK